MNFTQIQPFLDFILIMGLCSGRLIGFASMSVFFSQQYITGIARNAVIIALSLILVPVFYFHGAEILKGVKIGDQIAEIGDTIIFDGKRLFGERK